MTRLVWDAGDGNEHDFLYAVGGVGHKNASTRQRPNLDETLSRFGKLCQGPTPIGNNDISLAIRSLFATRTPLTMPKAGYYAVRAGRAPGIYSSWYATT